MSENKNPKTNDDSLNPAEEAKNEAQELIDSLKLDAQPSSSEEISDLSDVISNLQLDLPSEEESQEQKVKLDLALEAPQDADQSDINNLDIDESVLTPQQPKTEDINIDLSLPDPESTGESQQEGSQSLQLADDSSINPVKETEEITQPKDEDTNTNQSLSQDDKQPTEASEEQTQEKDVQQFSETQQDLSQPIISEDSDLDGKSDEPKQEDIPQEPVQVLQEEIPQPDPFEKQSTSNTQQETQPTSLEAQQQLNSLESLVEDTNSDQESLSLEKEIPTSLEEAYESEEAAPVKGKKGPPKGILIGVGGLVVLIGGALVFMASMPDVVANLLHKQQNTVSIAPDTQNTHPLQTQTEGTTQKNIEEKTQPQQPGEPPTGLEPTQQEQEQEPDQTNLTSEDLQLRLADIQQLMDEVEFPSTKDKIRAKVLQKKISALIDQGDLQKADYLLNQLEELIYGGN